MSPPARLPPAANDTVRAEHSCTSPVPCLTSFANKPPVNTLPTGWGRCKFILPGSAEMSVLQPRPILGLINPQLEHFASFGTLTLCISAECGQK
ncbi:hypothetical protein MHYP_G00134080 [Metynnis hypsauchen]